MSDNYHAIERDHRNTGMLLRLFELLQVLVLEALQEIERIEKIERCLNEIQIYLIRAADVLATSGTTSLPPELNPAALVSMVQAARQRSELPLEKRKRRKLKTDADKELERAAQVGVTDYKMHCNADGSAIVTIEGIEFRLSTTLAKLLALLADPQIGAAADDPPSATDKFVPFKTNAELRMRLEQTLNRHCSASNLRNLVHRLRREFNTARVNRYFIQTGPEGQMRLVRRLP